MNETALSTRLALGSLLISSLAAAQSPVTEHEPTETMTHAPSVPSAPGAQTVSHWYGWQTLATDGTALALSWMTISATGGGESSGSGVAVLAIATVGTYALGAPIVHFSHDNPGRGLGSLALRGLLPALGWKLGTSTSGCGYRGNSCATLGTLLGVAGAITLDAAVFSYEQLPMQSESGTSFGVAADGHCTLLTAQGRF